MPPRKSATGSPKYVQPVNEASANQQPPLVPSGQSGFKAGSTPIKFYDEEVKRMHRELEKREREQQHVVRQSVRPSGKLVKRQSGVTITGFLIRVFVFYVLIAKYIVCPNDKDQSRAVCRSLDSVQKGFEAVLPPIQPYFTRAGKKLDPYVEQVKSRTQPYVDTFMPYYNSFEKTLDPYANKVNDAYNQFVHPNLVHGVTTSQKFTKPYVDHLGKQYKKSLAPSVEWYSRAVNRWYGTNAKPHVDFVSKKSQEIGKSTYDTVSPLYFQGVPLAQKHYQHTLLPAAQQTYKTSRDTYLNQVHPQVLLGSRHLNTFYQTRVLPALQRFYSLYIAPQVDKISERIFEYRTKKVKTQAAHHVDDTEAEIVKEHDAKNLEELLQEDRDVKYVGKTSTANPEGTTAPRAPSKADTKAATAEKRAVLESLQASYEAEIAKLGSTEQSLLVERLVQIRQAAVEDVPMRFNEPVQAIDKESAKMIDRLESVFARAADNEKLTVEDKVKDSEFFAKKASAKIAKMATDTQAEAALYKKDLEQKEQRAIEKAVEAVSSLVAKAQEELGFGWTWLDDVSTSDWQRYHSLADAEKKWTEQYAGIQSGRVKEAALLNVNPYTLLDQVQSSIKTITASFDSLLSKSKSHGQKVLKGEWTGVANEAQKAYDAASDKVGAVVNAVKASASSVVGATASPTNAQESASSLASVARDSAVSAASVASASASSLANAAYQAVPTAVPAVPTDYFVDSLGSVSSVAGSAASSAASAASAAYNDAAKAAASAASSASSVVSSLAAPHSSFASPQPIASSISSAAQQAASAASSMYGDASQYAIKAAGGEPSPTNLQQTVTYAAAKASSRLVSGAEDLKSSASSIASAASAAAASASSVVSSYGEPHSAYAKSSLETPIASRLSIVAAAASSRLHDATRTTAEGARETVESVASAAKSAVSSVIHGEL